MIEPQLGISVRWYKQEAKNEILEDQTARVRSAANFIRRTARKAAGQLGPSISISEKIVGPDGKQRKRIISRTFTASSEPGDPPYRRTGRLQDSIGYDLKKKTDTWTASATIGIEAHGWEVGKNGVKRPTLAPVFERNKPVVAGILTGRFAAPQTGDLGNAAHRKPRRTNEQYVTPGGKARTRSTLGYRRA